MRITHADDADAGTTTLTFEFPSAGDPDHVADLVWAAAYRLLDRRRRGLGTVPERMREAGSGVQDQPGR